MDYGSFDIRDDTQLQSWIVPLRLRPH